MLRKISTNSSLSRLGLFHFGKAMFDLLLHLWLACRFGVARFCNITTCTARGRHIHFGRVFFLFLFFLHLFEVETAFSGNTCITRRVRGMSKLGRFSGIGKTVDFSAITRRYVVVHHFFSYLKEVSYEAECRKM